MPMRVYRGVWGMIALKRVLCPLSLRSSITMLNVERLGPRGVSIRYLGVAMRESVLAAHLGRISKAKAAWFKLAVRD